MGHPDMMQFKWSGYHLSALPCYVAACLTAHTTMGFLAESPHLELHYGTEVFGVVIPSSDTELYVRASALVTPLPAVQSESVLTLQT